MLVTHRPQVVKILLTFGANIHAINNEALQPVHKCIQKDHKPISSETLVTLLLLVSFGSTWDAKCDQVVASGTAWDEAPGLRICVLLWSQERSDGLPLSNIPIEVVKRGASDTQAYIDALKVSVKTIFRRKLCVIGPSHWGKTSLVKSLTNEVSSLDHVDDRTIGIDIFSVTFDNGSDRYHITIWGYAGHEEYQPAHAVFFSERTLYVVCVDLHSASLAKTQSDFLADDDSEYENRMDEFVSRKILRWIRLVFARQPDVEFVLVGTKADVIRHNATRIAEVREDLLTRLEDYAAAYERERSGSRDRSGSQASGQRQQRREA